MNNAGMLQKVWALFPEGPEMCTIVALQPVLSDSKCKAEKRWTNHFHKASYPNSSESCFPPLQAGWIVCVYVWDGQLDILFCQS